MPEDHVILLANFYGTYLNKDKFTEFVIINNAGIEQLATAGLDKINAVKLRASADDNIYLLMVAGLTDVIIKSVEDGKNKLEIAPNTVELIQRKMKWAQAMFSAEGVKVIWVVMPPISLQMYHKAEGWDISGMPGMSSGLVVEQKTLNAVMLQYRFLCLNLNAEDGGRNFKGPFFTGQVAELSPNGKHLHLNTSLFQSDGISPTEGLTTKWTEKIDKLFIDLKKRGQHFLSKSGDLLPRNRSESLDPEPVMKLSYGRRGDVYDRLGGDRMDRERVLTREYGHREKSRTLSMENEEMINRNRVLKRTYAESERVLPRSASALQLERERHNTELDRGDYIRRNREMRDYNPVSKLPHLEGASASLRSPERYDSMALPDADGQANPSDTMATAVQLLAATMHQLAGGNANYPFNALVDPQRQPGSRESTWQEKELLLPRKLQKTQQDMETLEREEAHRQFLERKLLEENIARQQMEADRKFREERVLEEKNRIELQRLLETRRRREEDLENIRQRQRAETREAQLKEQQLKAHQLEQVRRSMASQQHTKDEQAKLAIPKKMQSNGIASAVTDASSSVIPSTTIYTQDSGWKYPTVLFSCLNRNKVLKPLRGVLGNKVEARSSKGQLQLKGRGHIIYKAIGADTPLLSYLKIGVNKPGVIAEYETKVADFNNRVMDMMSECEALLSEGRAMSYIVRREVDEPKEKKASKEQSANSTSKSVSDTKKPQTDTKVEKTSKERSANSTNTSRGVSDTRKPQTDTKDGQRKYRFEDRKFPSSSVGARDNTGSFKTSAHQAKDTNSFKPRWDRSDDESEEELMYEEDDVIIIGSDEEEEDATINESNKNASFEDFKNVSSGISAGGENNEGDRQQSGGAETTKKA